MTQQCGCWIDYEEQGIDPAEWDKLVTKLGKNGPGQNAAEPVQTESDGEHPTGVENPRHTLKQEPRSLGSDVPLKSGAAWANLWALPFD